MSECDLETSTMRRPRATRAVEPGRIYLHCPIMAICDSAAVAAIDWRLLCLKTKDLSKVLRSVIHE